jgi:adenosine deaminase
MTTLHGRLRPTVELHRHFEAGLRPETIARLAARHGIAVARTRKGQVVPGVDPQDPDSIRRYYRAVAGGFGSADGVDRFKDSFGLPLSVLRSLDDLEQAVFEQLLDCAEAGSLHTELRGSPFTYRENVTASIDEIAEALVRGVERAWEEAEVSGTFLLAFSREKGLGGPGDPQEKRQAGAIAALAAELHRPDRPVGLDIAGFGEAAHPPRAFREALQPAIDADVPITVHAGEQGTPPLFAEAPASLIAEAIERLGARRIGHGTALGESAEVRALVRERGVGVECCPVSNEKMRYRPVAGHPLPMLLAEGLLVSLATDDPLMFGPFSVSETFDEIAGPLGLDDAALGRLTWDGLQTAFVTDGRRSVLERRLDALSAPPTPR